MLSINSLDDLKSRLGKVILMILVVKFFELAIGMDFEDVYDLLMFAGGIVLISGSLFLTEFTTKTEKGADPRKLGRRTNDCKACRNGNPKDCEVCKND